MSRPTHVTVSQDAGYRFVQRGIEGPVVMLNLLRFRETADYSEAPHLAPDAPLSGREAYERYIAHTLPFLETAGSEVLFNGEADAFLIGPQDERWDRALLVRHRSVPEFLAFAQNEDYLHIAGHRTAALEDSRLLPLIENRFGE
ncbi:MAG: DUF1330 domain-containing protein [Bacteroidota bacterium]